MTGRDEEFRAWVTERRPALLRTATLLTAGDSHTAEDVVQTTLTRLYLAWPRVRVAQQRDAYARRSLVNAFTDETRRSWRRTEESRAELPDTPVPAAEASDEETRVLYLALAELPPRMRAAVVLRYFHDLSTQETARVLHCTQGTVKSQTARALDKLHARLGPSLRADGSPPPPLRPAPAALPEVPTTAISITTVSTAPMRSNA